MHGSQLSLRSSGMVRGTFKLLAVLFSLSIATCGAEFRDGGDGEVQDITVCPERPTAYVMALPGEDQLANQLAQAGFVVEPLPTDRSPGLLRGALVIGSGASARSDYSAYVMRYADDLRAFVDRANVLVQFPQDASEEPSPAFLPSTQGATRAEQRTEAAFVTAQSDMVGEFAVGDALPLGEEELVPFSELSGFSVIVAGAPEGDEPLLIEGAYGQGRIVLSGMALDRGALEGDRGRFTQSFFQGLLDHVRDVCARDTDGLSIGEGGAAVFAGAGEAMLAVLPDTQVYALRFPGVFTTQTGWIAANAERLNIRYVFHLGDVVNNNTPIEWQRAAESMSLLEGHVPYLIVPGNHDYGPSGDASTRDTLLNDYFSFQAASQSPGFGGAYEVGRQDNTYHLFSVAGREFIVIALEWGPRDEVIAWANGVMDAHPERDGILVTHAYLNNTSRRYDHTDRAFPQDFNPHEYATPGGVNDGEELWQKLVRHHNFVMTLNGHVLGTGLGYLQSVTDTGTRCHQMLSNYQTRNLGGDGYMRLLQFMPDGHAVRVWTYSPLYDRLLDEEGQNFTIELD